MKKKNNTI